MYTHDVLLYLALLLFTGLNKLTKKLRKPNAIPNNELLDFLSRSPTDLELVRFVCYNTIVAKRQLCPLKL